MAQTSIFERFVECGRLVVFTAGKNIDKTAVIVDILDTNRVLVDGPTTGVKRQVANTKALALTDLRIQKLPRGIREKGLKKALTKSGILKKWEATGWAKKIKAAAKRESANDFERFKVYLARKKRNAFIAQKTKELSAAAGKAE